LEPVDTAAVQAFTSILSLVTLVGAAASLAVWAISGRWAPAARARSVVGESGLWLAAVVAIGATVGSLYFSEVAGFVPCRLCWFQRIAMYPLAPILLVAAARRDLSVGWYVLPLAVIGAGVAGYHSLIEWRPSLEGGACSAFGPSCADIWFREFGFVTLAFMALVGFLSIIVFTMLAVRPRRGTEPS
jgi:disulfide bond formation protein DsbB